MIGALADNGGPTLSHMPITGSPAINSGGPGCPTPDQRGALRVGGCDAGSVEFGSAAPIPSPTPSPAPAPVTYPMGDADCSDGISPGDILAELRDAGRLDEPDFCGHTGGCVLIDAVCYPSWTDVNCDGAIDGRDALWVLLHEIGSAPDPPFKCWAIGTYAVG